MFGYVRPRQADLLVREYDLYRAVYCGVCRAMKKETGRLSTATLSYDIVFLALVRMLYGDRAPLHVKRCRCIAHPCRHRAIVTGHPALTYSARASAVIAYHKLKDDIADSSFFRRLPYRLAQPVMSRAKKKAHMQKEGAQLAAWLAELSQMEKSGLASVDRPADLCGKMLGLLFAAEAESLLPQGEATDGEGCGESCGTCAGCDRQAAPPPPQSVEEIRDTLYAVGYELGKFVYAADAADDYADDCKTGSYNPYRCLYGSEGLSPEVRKDIHMGLMLQLSALEAAVLRLPFAGADAVENIIKNTIYEGLPDKIAFLLTEEGVRTKKERQADTYPL